MLRATVAAATMACAIAAAPSASAQDVRVNIGVGPRVGYGSTYGNYAPSYRVAQPRFYDQRYYGDWRDYRGIRAPDYPPHHHHHHQYCPPYWDGRYYFGR